MCEIVGVVYARRVRSRVQTEYCKYIKYLPPTRASLYTGRSATGFAAARDPRDFEDFDDDDMTLQLLLPSNC